MNYVEVNIDFNTIEPWREIVISSLAEKGAESFVETKTGCKAYFPEQEFIDIDALGLQMYSNRIRNISAEVIKDQNWNAAWESNFDPVYVGNELAIIAPFHNQDSEHKIKIIIQPQMSFGTGHHQTTWLMAKKILSLDVKNKIVLDMGTGTGVLAILAEQLGAREVFAPDIDTWAYENAMENAKHNHCKKIEWALGGAELLGKKTFDIIIANINKNILIEQLDTYAAVSNANCKLLLSGFFSTDTNSLVEEAKKYGFIFENSYSKDEWALLEFIKK